MGAEPPAPTPHWGTRYLLALKYIDVLTSIVKLPNTDVKFMPAQTAFVQTAAELGMNTAIPPSQA